jgi:predicted DNA-binding transcriptional regulator AlpA
MLEPTSQRTLRLPQIIGPNGLLPIARSTFYGLVADGKMPKPVKLGRISLWREKDLYEALAALHEQPESARKSLRNSPKS